MAPLRSFSLTIGTIGMLYLRLEDGIIAADSLTGGELASMTVPVAERIEIVQPLNVASAARR